MPDMPTPDMPDFLNPSSQSDTPASRKASDLSDVEDFADINENKDEALESCLRDMKDGLLSEGDAPEVIDSLPEATEDSRRQDARRVAIIQEFRNAITQVQTRLSDADRERMQSGYGYKSLLHDALRVSKSVTPSLLNGGNIFQRVLARCPSAHEYIKLRMRPIGESLTEVSDRIDKAVEGILLDIESTHALRGTFLQSLSQLGAACDECRDTARALGRHAEDIRKSIDESGLPSSDFQVIAARQELAEIARNIVRADRQIKNYEDSIVLMESEFDKTVQKADDLQAQADGLRASQEALNNFWFTLMQASEEHRMIANTDLMDALHAMNSKIIVQAARKSSAISLRIAKAAERPAIASESIESVLKIRGREDIKRAKIIEDEYAVREKSRRRIAGLVSKYNVGTSLSVNDRRAIEQAKPLIIEGQKVNTSGQDAATPDA